jgi:hypothetical protein
MRLHHNPSPERIRLNVIASAREEINPLKEYKRKQRDQSIQRLKDMRFSN